MAGNQSIYAVGKVENLEIGIVNQTFSCEAFVIENASQELLLGKKLARDISSHHRLRY